MIELIDHRNAPYTLQPGQKVYSYGLDYKNQEGPDHGQIVTDEDLSMEKFLDFLAEAGHVDGDWPERFLDEDDWEFEASLDGPMLVCGAGTSRQAFLAALPERADSNPGVADDHRRKKLKNSLLK